MQRLPRGWISTEKSVLSGRGVYEGRWALSSENKYPMNYGVLVSRWIPESSNSPCALTTRRPRCYLGSFALRLLSSVGLSSASSLSTLELHSSSPSSPHSSLLSHLFSSGTKPTASIMASLTEEEFFRLWASYEPL